MRDYEALLVLQPELEDDNVNELIDRVVDIVDRGGGDVTGVGQLIDRKGNVAEVDGSWGKRRLAYPIKGHLEGVFSIIRLTMEPGTVEEIEASLRINEDVLRYLIVRDEDYEPIVKAAPKPKPQPVATTVDAAAPAAEDAAAGTDTETTEASSPDGAGAADTTAEAEASSEATDEAEAVAATGDESGDETVATADDAVENGGVAEVTGDETPEPADAPADAQDDATTS